MAPRMPEEPTLLLKGTRTASSFVLEARRLSISDPYPAAGQPGYSVMADVLSRAVLFANWEVVGAAALVRAADKVWVAEAGLTGRFRTDEFMRRLTWRMLADATHELLDISEIQDAWRTPMQVSAFVARRRATRRIDQSLRPVPIGPLTIPLDDAMQERMAEMHPRDLIPRAPRTASL